MRAESHGAARRIEKAPIYMSITNGKPKALVPQLDEIPVELRNHNRWLVWRYEPAKTTNGKPPAKPYTKVPIDARRNRYASTTKPWTWTNFLTARSTYEKYHGKHCDGIGCVIAPGTVGIDLDDCVMNGTPLPWAEKIITLLDSYTELSPSGNGIRIFVQGQIPGKRNRAGKIEMYDEHSPRYLTVTGHRIGTRETVEPRQEQLNTFYAGVFGAEAQSVEADGPVPAVPTPETPEAPEEMDEDRLAAILDVATRAKNGDHFLRLWAGDWAGAGYPSQSEADLALCGLLAFYVGDDPTGIDEVFRRSGLYRDKWEDRDDYREDTIAKSLDGKDDFYDWGMTDIGSRVEEVIGASTSVASAPTVLAPATRSEPKRRGYFYDELLKLPPCTWQIDKIIPSESVACLYGPSQSGKSFVALDMSLCVATGKPWIGDHKVVQGKVVYVAAEGEHGIRKRLQAWQNYYGHNLGREILVVPYQFNLLEEVERTALLKLAVEQLGTAPTMLVIDTLAKNFNGDENTAKDMSRFVNNCIALRKSIGGTVVIVHHSGKDATKGARGSVSLLQGVETQIEASGSVGRGTTLRCEKQKDAVPFNPINPQKHWMPIPDDPEGSLVMVREKVGLKLTEEKRVFLSVLKDAFGDRTWSFMDGHKVLSGMAKTTYSDKLKHLAVEGWVVSSNDGYYLSGEALGLLLVSP